MVRIRTVTIAFLLCAYELQAQTVVQNSNLTFGASSSFGANHVALVWQNAAANDPTSAWLKYDLQSVRFVGMNLDAGSDWYVVQPGDVFSPENIQAGVFTPLATFGPAFYPAAHVGDSDFWLGVATSIRLLSDRSVFGWVRLHPTDTDSLVMVENVMSYDSPGIIVGTTTLAPTPEPASWVLSLTACAVPISWRSSIRRRLVPHNRSDEHTLRLGCRS